MPEVMGMLKALQRKAKSKFCLVFDHEDSPIVYWQTKSG